MVEAEFKPTLGRPKGHALSTESFSAVLSSEVTTNHVWLFKFIKMKENLKLSFSITLATFQMLSGHMWLVAATLDSTDTGHFHPRRKFSWKVLF